MYQSLHSHTTQSDGLLSHHDLMLAAKKNNISTLAFTDHDTLMHEKTLKELKENAPINWISGIEIDTGMPEGMEGSISGFHVVALFIDPTNQNLIDHCKKAQAARIERMQKIIKNLAGIGINIKEEDCFKASSGESVGRPHIVQAILSYPENLKRIEEIRLDMQKAGENDADVQAKYKLMMQQGSHQYPYTLFLDSRSFIQNIYMEIPYKPKLDQCTKLVHDAGGVNVVAHYITAKNKIPLEVLEKLYAEDRIDGAETVWGLWLFGTDREQEMLDDRQKLRDLNKKYNRITSGGADVHREQDLVDFSNNKAYAEETVGMVEKIIQSGKVNLEFSSFKNV